MQNLDNILFTKYSKSDSQQGEYTPSYLWTMSILLFFLLIIISICLLVLITVIVLLLQCNYTINQPFSKIVCSYERCGYTGTPRWFSGVLLLGVLELLPYVRMVSMVSFAQSLRHPPICQDGFYGFFRSLRVHHALSNMDTTWANKNRF